MAFFSPAFISRAGNTGILLQFEITHNKRRIGSEILQYVSCEESIEAIFDAFNYCVDTGLPSAAGCMIDFSPQTVSEIKIRNLRVSGDSLSLAVALSLIEYVKNLNIKSKIIATGAIRKSNNIWNCNSVSGVDKKIILAKSLNADAIVVPQDGFNNKYIYDQDATIICMPLAMPSATSLLEFLHIE